MRRLDHFGLLAPFYERAIPLRDAEQFVKRVGLPVDGALLDAGGGTGRVAQAFQGLATRVVVADLSSRMLHQANQKEGLQVVCSHTEKLPFPEEYFERVVMVDALHHVCDQVETASELWRVIKPGGRIVIEEPDYRTLIVKFVAIAEKLLLMRSHFLAPGRIKALFAFPGAQSWIEKDGFNAWITIEKIPN